MPDKSKTHFTGTFYFVTQWSIYQCKIEALDKVPVITKVAFRSERSPKVTPVGGTLKPRFHWAITNLGVIAYQVSRHQSRISPTGPIARVEELPSRFRGSQTKPLIGLFLERNEADSCLGWAATQTGTLAAFQTDFDQNTVEVLSLIGLRHPLISLSVRGTENKAFDLPFRLLSKLPDAELE